MWYKQLFIEYLKTNPEDKVTILQVSEGKSIEEMTEIYQFLKQYYTAFWKMLLTEYQKFISVPYMFLEITWQTCNHCPVNLLSTQFFDFWIKLSFVYVNQQRHDWKPWKKYLFHHYFISIDFEEKNYTQLLCIFDQQMHACACLRMVKNDEKHWKMMKKWLDISLATYIPLI